MAWKDDNMSPERMKALEDGLLELMKSRPFHQISVKELTDHLQISRKTFYQYFPHKQACLESLTDRLIYECGTPSLSDNPGHRLQFWIDHRDFLEAISRNHLSLFLVERFLRFIQREDLAILAHLRAAKVELDEDILFFFASGEIHLLLKWCDEGFPLSVEDMLRKQQILAQNFLPPQQ